jgi:arylsulfatase A-like enzyme
VASLVTVAVVLGAVAAAAWYVGGAQRPFVEVSMTANGGPDGGQIPGGLPTSQIKNVVLVLADDMDWKLWREVPRLAALQSEGTTFTNYVVSESLCCPSRSTIFRGQYVHNHHVVSNTIETDGGWPTFRNFGYPSDCLPAWLQNAGVQTGLIGKYLNQFPQTAAEETYVAPGWNTFVVPASRATPYSGYDYTLDVNGVDIPHGSTASDYIGDVLNGYADQFLTAPKSPFFLEVATFAPHLPAPVAPRHVGSHMGAQAPRDPSFNALVTNPPSWLAPVPKLDEVQVADVDHLWQQRLESAESVADTVDQVKASLKADGHLKDTLIIVTSDNGFHAGSYGLARGKRTAFDTDTVVPMVMIGPGITAGRVVDQMVSETDLGPTVTDLLHAATPPWVDGRSLVPLLARQQVSWRTGVLTENIGISQPGDPDDQLLAPHGFEALVTQQWLYIESGLGDVELYNRKVDPYELVNVAGSTSPVILSQLKSQLNALKACAGETCRTADAMVPFP